MKIGIVAEMGGPGKGAPHWQGHELDCQTNCRRQCSEDVPSNH